MIEVFVNEANALCIYFDTVIVLFEKLWIKRALRYYLIPLQNG
jgi:hypothetical protein